MTLSLEEFSKEDDEVIESMGVKVVFAKHLDTTLENAVVDYSDKWHSRGFSIRGTGASTC